MLSLEELRTQALAIALLVEELLTLAGRDPSPQEEVAARYRALWARLRRQQHALQYELLAPLYAHFYGVIQEAVERLFNLKKIDLNDREIQGLLHALHAEMLDCAARATKQLARRGQFQRYAAQSAACVCAVMLSAG